MKAITVLSMILLFTTTSFSQDVVKFGYVNSDDILEILPETAPAEKELEVYADSLKEKMSTMSEEYQTKVSDYQENYNTMSDSIKQVKEKEITELQVNIEALQQSADQDIGAKQAELFIPILKKVKEAITAVGRENSYTYIFDIAIGGLAFYEMGDNILPLVKKKLGLN